MKNLLAFLLLLAPISAVAQAQETENYRKGWLFLGDDNTNTKVFARMVDILKGMPNLTKARVWVMLDHSKDRTTDVRETKFLFEVNCPNQTYKIITTAETYPNNRIVTDTPTYTPVKYIVPGSSMEAVHENLCADNSEFARQYNELEAMVEEAMKAADEAGEAAAKAAMEVGPE